MGQARNFYQYAALLINESQNQPSALSPSPLERGWGEVNEDSLAYLRNEREYKNLLLAEQPNVDWGQTVLRQFLFSQFQFLLFQQLKDHKNEQLAAIAGKSLKETTYHLRWSSEWVIRLGDGTNESHTRMLHAIDELWRYTGEMFEPADYEKEACADFSSIKNEWIEKVKAVFNEATLPVPEKTFAQSGGKTGTHAEHLGFILTELQYMQRAYPNSQW